MRQEDGDVSYRVLARGPSPMHAGGGSGGEGSNDSGDSDDAAVRDYFNLTPCGRVAAVSSTLVSTQGPACDGDCLSTLRALSDEWASADARFSDVRGFFPGARMLRQVGPACVCMCVCECVYMVCVLAGSVEGFCAQQGMSSRCIRRTDRCLHVHSLA